MGHQSGKLSLPRLARLLLFPRRPQAAQWGLEKTALGPLLWSSQVDLSLKPLLLSPGFGSSVYDYAHLAELFGQKQPVLRVGHPGSDRRAALEAGLRLLWHRWVGGQSDLEAARRVRTWLHRPASRARRLEQLRAAVEAWQLWHGEGPLDLAGHSFGSDTALSFVLRYGEELPIDTLYLFSPHPPGYLIPTADYGRLPVRRVVVISGTHDRTRDGVTARERMQVMSYLRPSARAVLLEGVGHMDFALAGLGPPHWTRQLARELED